MSLPECDKKNKNRIKNDKITAYQSSINWPILLSVLYIIDEFHNFYKKLFNDPTIFYWKRVKLR